MALIAELDQSLEALRALKPPGVSKSKVASITNLFVENIQNEYILVQRIVSQFKEAPATHKLGVLYVIDSIIRQWRERACSLGQDLDSNNAPPGTFAAGVSHFAEQIPSLMDVLTSTAPPDQKDKILKLIDIWVAGEIFHQGMLSEFKNRLLGNAPSNSQDIFQPAQYPPPNSTIPQYSNGGHQNGLSNGYNTASLPTSPTEANNTMQQQPHTTSQDQSQALMTYMNWLQELANRGVPQDEWPEILGVLQKQARSAAQSSTDRSNSRQRDRSRSPIRRPSPGPELGGTSAYRSRSPAPSNSPSKQMDKISFPVQPKWLSHDPNLPPNHIKVLSRTLFVGGNTCDEDELRQIFSQFGEVQTCIPNHVRKHAFVKMTRHEFAVRAKAQMERVQDSEMLKHIRQTKWGVGFGPRECCNYQDGFSVIPIDRLTEADQRWVLTAEFGGTGGTSISPGMVLEEPDIEVGAGLSSKAISGRRAFSSPNSRQRRQQQPSKPSRGNKRQEDSQAPPSLPQLPPQAQPQPMPTYAPPPPQMIAPPPAVSMARPLRPPESYDTNALGVSPAVPGFGFQLPGFQ